MSNTPLPRLPDGWWKDKVTEAQMESFIHAHAAAVSAADNAALREALQLSLKHGDGLTASERAMCLRALRGTALGDKNG